MAFTMDTTIPQLSGLDGLLYDATVAVLNGRVLPIAFGETITHSYEGARFNTFTSARGVRSISYRGDAPRNLSVSLRMPWKYVATVLGLERVQRDPIYVISPLARRTNVLPPWFDWSDVRTGNHHLRVNHESNLSGSARSLSDIAYTGTSTYGPFVMDSIRTKSANIYGREASVPTGATYRFRAGTRSSGGSIPRAVGLIGFDSSGNKVWTSPFIEASGTWGVRTSEEFTIPDTVAAVRDFYDASLVSFSPMQLWIGTHEPPPSPRMGGTFQISDLSFTEAPSTKAKLYDVSYTLKEVAP